MQLPFAFTLKEWLHSDTLVINTPLYSNVSILQIDRKIEVITLYLVLHAAIPPLAKIRDGQLNNPKEIL